MFTEVEISNASMRFADVPQGVTSEMLRAYDGEGYGNCLGWDFVHGGGVRGFDFVERLARCQLKGALGNEVNRLRQIGLKPKFLVELKHMEHQFEFFAWDFDLVALNRRKGGLLLQFPSARQDQPCMPVRMSSGFVAFLCEFGFSLAIRGL